MTCKNQKGFEEWKMYQFDVLYKPKQNAVERENNFIDFISEYGEKLKKRFCNLVCLYRHICPELSIMGKEIDNAFLLKCRQTKRKDGKECSSFNCQFFQECQAAKKEERIVFEEVAK